MGQKVHPYGFRLGVIKTWNSKWFEDKAYAKWLHEDIRVKRAVKDYLMNANIAGVEVERAANKAGAPVLKKLIESAVANARTTSPGVDLDSLFVETAFVDKAPNKHMRRWRPRAMGRATRIQKGLSHITVILGERA